MNSDMFGEVKYTYVAWHMCNFCSRAYKDIDKLLDHKFENHHDQFMGIESTPLLETRTLNLPRTKSGLGRKRAAEAIPVNEEENESIECATSKLDEDAEHEMLAITKTSKHVAQINDICGAEGLSQDNRACKKKRRVRSPPQECPEDENEDKEVPQGYKLRHKSSAVKQDQHDLYLACSYCKETFSTLEGLKSHESWEMSRRKPKTSDKSEDDDKLPAQSSGESSEEISPMTAPIPRQLARKTPTKEDRRKAKSAALASAAKNEPETERDYPVFIPRKFKRTTPKEQGSRKSRTPMRPGQVIRAQELSPPPARMRASIEPPKTIRCAYCWQKFGEEEYGEHRKICTRRLRNSFTARKSTSNIDLAATVEQLTQQVEAVSAGSGKQVEEEM